jgi:hypothetical protein
MSKNKVSTGADFELTRPLREVRSAVKGEEVTVSSGSQFEELGASKAKTTRGEATRARARNTSAQKPESHPATRFLEAKPRDSDSPRIDSLKKLSRPGAGNSPKGVDLHPAARFWEARPGAEV